MELLGYFLLWGGILFLLHRLGLGTHALRDGLGQRGLPLHGSGRSPKQFGWTAPTTAVDPVCGKTVQTSAARSSVDDGAVHYFCSRECRERFEVAPKLYLGQPPETSPAQTTHDHG